MTTKKQAEPKPTGGDPKDGTPPADEQPPVQPNPKPDGGTPPADEQPPVQPNPKPDGGTPPADESSEDQDAVADTRAAALAALAGDGVDEPDEDPAPVPAPIEPTGQVINLADGDDVASYLVVASKISWWVHGNFRVARKGDTVRLSAEQADRHLSKGYLVAADD